MDRNAMYGLGLGVVAIVIALIAIVVAMVSSGGDVQPANLSGVEASLAAQNAEIDLLEGRIEGLQGQLAAQPDLSASVTELQQRMDAIAGMEMSMDTSRIDHLDDELHDVSDELADVSAALADLEQRLDEVDKPAMSMDTDAIDERIDELGDELSALNGTIAALQEQLAAGAGVVAAEFAAVTVEIESIRMALEELQASTLDEEVEAAVARLDWLEMATAPAYTKAYVEEAIRRYDSEGRTETLDFYNTMDSVDGDLYLFVIDANSKLIVVEPTIPGNIGEDIRGEIGTDITGKNFGFEIATADENGKWVDYVYLNPANDFAYERKHAWVIKHDHLIFASGWYERDISLDGASAASYTRSFVEQAIARYDANGRDATIDYYNTPESVDGQYYVFIGDENDIMLAHATVPANVGKHFNDVISPDGYPAGAQVAAAAVEGGAWTTYTYLNAATGNVETKHSWVTRHNGMIFGSGWYEEGPPKSEAAAYTKAFVERAINLYDDLGRDGTIAYYNSPESVDGQYYVFIGDENDVMIAHAAVPDNVGVNFDDIISPTDGYPAGAQVAAAAVEGGAWTTYTYLNAATGNVETKHSWVTRHNGMIFGSGWYEEGPPKSEEAGYAQSLVQRAVNLYDDLGRDGTIDYYNMPESVDGQFYVFILRAHDLRTFANGARPELVDIDPPARIDAAGYAYGEAFAATTDEGHWVSYVFTNPATDELESKHTWIMEHDGLLFGSGWYAEPASYTQYLVNEAISMHESEGHEEAIAYYNSPDSVDGQWYVFAVDADDLSSIANPNLPDYVGTIPARIDPTGYYYGGELKAVTEEGKWISYVIRNPQTGVSQRKHTWVALNDGIIWGSGWYEPIDSPKDEPALYVRSLVEDAIERYEADGHDSTVEYYNTEESVDGEFYVFIGDKNDVMIAHATIPENVGKRHDEIVSTDGYPAGAQVAAAATEDGAWTSYTYINPATGNVQTKHSWVIRHEGMIFGSGWYEDGPTKSEPADYAQSLVQRALDLYDDLGREGTLDYFNMPESADGPWYVFVLEDREGELYSVANSNRPEIVGTTRERIDANGFNYGEATAAVTEEGGGEWISYLFTHPETREDAPKHSWVVRRGNLLFGAGWYEGIEE
ncbi:MAG: cache domain-containing protein [Chloroflexi bacterium]|nr:cache domain-containing protein [Chloroflexota bacterium]